MQPLLVDSTSTCAGGLERAWEDISSFSIARLITFRRPKTENSFFCSWSTYRVAAKLSRNESRHVPEKISSSSIFSSHTLFDGDLFRNEQTNWGSTRSLFFLVTCELLQREATTEIFNFSPNCSLPGLRVIAEVTNSIVSTSGGGKQFGYRELNTWLITGCSLGLKNEINV